VLIKHSSSSSSSAASSAAEGKPHASSLTTDRVIFRQVWFLSCLLQYSGLPSGWHRNWPSSGCSSAVHMWVVML
jgi:hypothetical protein